MSVTWRGVPDPPSEPITPAGRLRIAVRGAALLLAIGLALVAFGATRAVERPLHGVRRPWSPLVKQAGFRAALAIVGLRRRVSGEPFVGLGAQVANHASWLDIFALNATSRVTFVSKAEVRGWPLLGWLAAIGGTVFITRRRSDSAVQQALLRERLEAGETLVFFPEGTSTDGRRVLPFRSTLFAVFAGAELEDARVQPVSLVYVAPDGRRADLYGWWGGMALLPHLARVLAAPQGGWVEIVHHAPLQASDHRDRKALARRAEGVVRSGLEARIGSSPGAAAPAASAPAALSEAAR